jgi:Peptidase inhibitor family I36
MNHFAKYMTLIVLLVAGASCAVEPSDDSPADVSEVDNTQTPDIAPQVQARESGSPSSIAGDDISIDDADISVDAASDCPAGFFCLWHDAGFLGRRVQFQDAGCQDLTTFGFNDQASSWFNRNNGTYRVYKDIGCRTFLFSASSGARASQSGFNDQASSICRGTCPP